MCTVAVSGLSNFGFWTLEPNCLVHSDSWAQALQLSAFWLNGTVSCIVCVCVCVSSCICWFCVIKATFLDWWCCGLAYFPSLIIWPSSFLKVGVPKQQAMSPVTAQSTKPWTSLCDPLFSWADFMRSIIAGKARENLSMTQEVLFDPRNEALYSHIINVDKFLCIPTTHFRCLKTMQACSVFIHLKTFNMAWACMSDTKSSRSWHGSAHQSLEIALKSGAISFQERQSSKCFSNSVCELASFSGFAGQRIPWRRYLYLPFPWLAEQALAPT